MMRHDEREMGVVVVMGLRQRYRGPQVPIVDNKLHVLTACSMLAGNVRPSLE